MMTGNNLARHELIGLGLEIVRCTDPSLTGTAGRVVDETRNSLVVVRSSNGKMLRVGKRNCRFRFTIPGGTSAELEGNDITFRPEDRIKRCR
jgi:ribonuclease P protein subunit POP4